MTTLRQAAQQALEALDIADNIALVGAAYTPKSIDAGLRKIRDSATALREALAREHALHDLARLGQEIEQEPTPWREMVVVTLVREGIDKHKARELADHFAAQPKQEPVRWQWIFEDKHGDRYTHKNLFYTEAEAAESARICGVKAIKKTGESKVTAAPPAAQRPWQGLTDDEIKEIVGPYGDTPIKDYTRKLFDQIEAALRSKNT